MTRKLCTSYAGWLIHKLCVGLNAMLPSYCLELCRSVIRNEHSYTSSQKEKENALFPCIQVKHSLADFILSAVFLKGCFILLGEQKGQNSSLPLRSSQHLLRGSPTTITGTENACPTFALAAELRTYTGSSTQRELKQSSRPIASAPAALGSGPGEKGQAVAAATLVSKAAGVCRVL